MLLITTYRYFNPLKAAVAFGCIYPLDEPGLGTASERTGGAESAFILLVGNVRMDWLRVGVNMCLNIHLLSSLKSHCGKTLGVWFTAVDVRRTWRTTASELATAPAISSAMNT